VEIDHSFDELFVDTTLSSKIDDLAKLMLSLSPDGIALIDQDSLKVKLVNNSALWLLNATVEMLMGQPFPATLHGQEPHEICISRDGRDSLFISIRKREMVWSNHRYWILSMRDVTARVRLREQLRSDSLMDELTGLHNRRGFVSMGEHAISLVEREKRELILVFVDLDGMKDINDKFGHKNGDGAVEDVALLLRQTFRKSDILARIGGDEFAVIAHAKHHTDKEQILRRLLENLRALNEQARRPYELSLSVGFAHYDALQRCTLDDLLERADAAMYEDKRLKKNGRQARP